LQVGRRRLVVALVAVASLAVAATGAAYEIGGKPWPRGEIGYYNAATDQHWAIGQAVEAWNTSGANVRFVPTTYDRAQLVIKHFDASSGACVPHALATLGYRRGTRAEIRVTPWGAQSECSSFATARAVAHELGHVLGLGHELRACAAMNTSGSYRGTYSCPKTKPWEWKCRMLEEDDIRGAVRLYGGVVRVRRQAACPIYAAIGRPSGLAAEAHDSGRGAVATFRRPASPRIPQFLLRLASGSEESFAYRVGTSCASRLDGRTARYRWQAAPGAYQELANPMPAGRYCYAVWSIDMLGRPSAKPATAWVDLS
jgi:hypothetical protein